ncbi:hypothetical protein PHLGIDRAFT_224444 [Phlebiopsis gigantea 11061_1 CR5-6]|uniref:Uncharacterized protein n=1 Tax=Phlebiopsis gigantea (strain 11061_1 CR5-6) TaxID=745531 RepID=A0A0C3NGI0_PHLG1|nr:hypothetical protein PHLGIDRAFT_224444 [Phlebiopsis gigantea 11061_1 CR5-6]
MLSTTTLAGRGDQARFYLSISGGVANMVGLMTANWLGTPKKNMFRWIMGPQTIPANIALGGAG